MFHKSQRSIYGSNPLDFSQYQLFTDRGFEKIVSFQQATKPKSTNWQMQQPCNSRAIVENDH